MRFVPLCGLFAAAVLLASDAYPPPRFTDPERVRKLESALPEVDQIFSPLRGREKDSRHGVGRRHRWPARACRIGRRSGSLLQGPGHGRHGVSHRLDDEELHGSGDSQAARRGQAVARRSGLEVASRIRADGAADARHRAAPDPATPQPQRRLSGGQSLGRPATERQRRRSHRMAPPRDSVFHASRHALRVLQLRFRPAGPHCGQGLGYALRESTSATEILAKLHMEASTFEFSQVPAKQSRGGVSPATGRNVP